MTIPQRECKAQGLFVVGYAGQTVPIEVEDNGRIVSSQEVTLPADGESATLRVRFTTSEAGPRVFKFRIPTQPD